MQSLKDIVTAEEIVFFDSSVANMRSFSNEFRVTGLGFAPDLLEEDEDYLKEVAECLEKENVYTSHKVIGELKAAKDMICKKLKALNQKQKKIEKEGKRFRVVDDDTFSKLNRLAILMTGIVKLARRSEYGTDEDFQKIDDVFCLLGRYLKPRKPRDREKPKHDYRTDETLLATAYYAAIKERKPVCIVTQDSDFMALLPLIHGQLTAYDFDEERRFERFFQEHPVLIYVGNEDGYAMRISTREVVPADYFNIRNVPKLRMTRIKKRLKRELAFLNSSQNPQDVLYT